MVLDRPFWQACWSNKANATLTLILLALLLPAVAALQSPATSSAIWSLGNAPAPVFSITVDMPRPRSLPFAADALRRAS